MSTYLLIVLLMFSPNKNRVVMHYCEYSVTFVARDSGGLEDSETITITVNRPVDLKRITKFWLRANDGADLTEDGIVNFRDYAVWIQRYLDQNMFMLLRSLCQSWLESIPAY